MTEPEIGSDPREEEGALPAILATLVILIIIVVLFLLFKFNLFQGGRSIDVRTTAPAILWVG